MSIYINQSEAELYVNGAGELMAKAKQAPGIKPIKVDGVYMENWRINRLCLKYCKYYSRNNSKPNTNPQKPNNDAHLH